MCYAEVNPPRELRSGSGYPLVKMGAAPRHDLRHAHSKDGEGLLRSWGGWGGDERAQDVSQLVLRPVAVRVLGQSKLDLERHVCGGRICLLVEGQDIGDEPVAQRLTRALAAQVAK